MAERDLADIIRALRGGRSQTEFAHDVGISPGMIGHVEARRRSLSLESLTRIEQAHDGLTDAERAELREARQRASDLLNTTTRSGARVTSDVSLLRAELEQERSERRSEVQELRDQVEELIDQMAAIAEAVDVLRQQQGAGQSSPRAATE